MVAQKVSGKWLKTSLNNLTMIYFIAQCVLVTFSFSVMETTKLVKRGWVGGSPTLTFEIRYHTMGISLTIQRAAPHHMPLG